MACLISISGLNQPHHITNADLSSEVGGIAKRIKTARLRRKTNLQKSDYPKMRIKRDPNALCVLEYDNLYLCQIINIQCVISIIGGCEISRPYPNVGYLLEKFDAVFYQEIILSSGVFRRETASGFYPWCNVEVPCKRVAVGLCGWRHGNSFPMTQSAQSHRQMRSIPRCSKAVFYVFVFLIPFTIRQQCIIYPQKFSTEPK